MPKVILILFIILSERLTLLISQSEQLQAQHQLFVLLFSKVHVQINTHSARYDMEIIIRTPD